MLVTEETTSKIQQDLTGFVAIAETLVELSPDSSIRELIDYAAAVAKCPVSAQVLLTAMAALPAYQDQQVVSTPKSRVPAGPAFNRDRFKA